MARAYFVSGIGTEVGKTVASAVLQQRLDADYWKPVQAGDLDFGDRRRVQARSGFPDDRFHPERYRLKTPASPHYAARLDGLNIQLEDFTLPDSQGRNLLVEGAGGLLVPLNDRHTMVDLIEHLDLPVFLVSRHYLGSINHTLLSLALLRQRGIELAGLVYSGGNSPETVRIVEQLTGVGPYLEIPELSSPAAGPTLREGRAGGFG